LNPGFARLLSACAGKKAQAAAVKTLTVSDVFK
jgi:hypothetical protein